MRALLLKDFRCFRGEHVIPIAPLTILIGENSTGKTALLAAFRSASDIVRQELPVDFNEPPFLLGSFDEIAHHSPPRGTKTRSFDLGLELPAVVFKRRQNGASANDPVRVYATFRPKGTEPRAAEWRLCCGEYEITMSQKANASTVAMKTPSGCIEFDPLKGGPATDSFQPSVQRIAFARSGKGVKDLFPQSRGSLRNKRDNQVLGELAYRFCFYAFTRNRPFASAPIRTKPERTYDPLQELPQPEGGHVPMLLARLHAWEKGKWTKLREALDDFGKASGLFKDISVKRYGKRESGPFQLRIKVSGRLVNLVDVGYGVSQVLPIIVDVLQDRKDRTYLLQQPEVHLHPRAQAELGSFLGKLAKTTGKRFVVETHSDYLVDRIRMDIRDGRSLTSKDVALLYLERKGASVDIHHLMIDDRGNLTDAPASCRDFFLAEERRMLGV